MYLVVEFMYLVCTRMPGESCRRRPRPLLLCVDFTQRCIRLILFQIVSSVYYYRSDKAFMLIMNPENVSKE